MTKRLLIFLIIFLVSLFLGLKNTKAVELSSQTIVINEVEYDPPQSGTDSTYEWFELYNKSINDVLLDGWTISDNSQTDQIPTFNLKSKNFVVIVASENGFKVNFAELPENFIDLGGNIGGGLSNTGDHLILRDQNNDIIDQISWGTDTTILDPSISGGSVGGFSIERRLAGFDTDKEDDFIIQTQPTPGSENPSPIFEPPKLLSPLNGSIIVGHREVEFDWEMTEGSKDHLIISQSSDLLNPLNDTNQLGWGKYYWAVESVFGQEIKCSEIWTFELKDYSNAITLNEVMPNPIGDDISSEWIELYNNSDADVDLVGWKLIDASGKIYLIPQSTIIKAFGYLIVSRVDSDITLNNDGDEVKLYQPNNVLLSSTSFANDGGEGLSWARGPNGNWSWTTTPTQNAINVITLIPKPVVDKVDEPVIHTVPIEIYTGDIQNYLNKLVKIRGKVISTSGDTFYIDDGSGVAKIQIQTKTGIKKPLMHKNDVFEIIGVVDLYGQTWRILPQNQNDIRLIETAAKVNAKKATVKKAASAVVSAVKAPVVEKAVAAASSNNADANQNDNKINALDQLVKTMIGLAILFLVFLILKIWQKPKEKNIRQIGGHFGDDFT